MNRILPALLALFLIPTSAPAGESTEDLLARSLDKKKTDIERYHDLCAEAEPDPDKALQAPERTVSVPWGSVTIGGGVFVPILPKRPEDESQIPEGFDFDQPLGVVYVGEGRFEMSPPNETERWSMNFDLDDLGQKNADLEKIDVALKDGATLWFNGRWRDLFLEGTQPTQVDKKVAAAAKKMFKARSFLTAGSAAGASARREVYGGEIGYLLADLPTRDLKGVPALTYETDDADIGWDENVSLYVQKPYPLNKDVVEGWSLISWFDEETARGKSDQELGHLRLKKRYDIDHYNMDMTVFQDEDTGFWGMRVNGDLDLTFQVPMQGLRLAMMNYGENEFDPNADPDVVRSSGTNRVRVNTLTDGEGNPLTFLHAGHSLQIALPRVYQAGETLKLRFGYEGLFIMTITQPAPQTSLSERDAVSEIAGIRNFRVPNDYPWYPQADGHSDAFTFDWTLRLPKPMLAATSGTLLSVREEGGYNVHVIKETTPVTFPAILFGRFSVLENDPDYDKGEYKIRIYVHPGFEKDADSFIAEAAGVISFYESLFGKYPFMELDIAQMPIGTGYAQAPAGLIQMDGFTYISKTDAVNLYGANERTLEIRDNFIPHEIAHEWWGHKASWGSSRDQWVSETFAEYSASLYIEAREAKKSGDPTDTEGYEHRKEMWGAVGRMGHTFRRTGPIWIGNRTGPRRTSTIYARGPLVLDQLRQTFGRDAVVKMMGVWCQYADAHGGTIVTEDLQNILEEVVPGVKFDEFMKLYIKGNEPLPDDPKKDKAEGRASKY